MNDLVWAAALLGGLLLLRATGRRDVFWFVFAWGASAAVAAAVGPWQARVLPKLSATWQWLLQHKDLGPRYAASGLTGSAAIQLQTYGVGFILGLAAVGYVQAASTLMGPFMIIFYGIGLVTTPEAARILRKSPRQMPVFCALVSAGLAVSAVAWGVMLLVALPRGLGSWVLGSLWRPAYPLVLPQTLAVTAQGISAGAASGLGALGAARRSLRVMIFASVVLVVTSLAGAVEGGARGTVWGIAVAAWIAVLLMWWQLRAALRESGIVSAGDRLWSRRPSGQHRRPAAARSRRWRRASSREPS